MSFETPGPDQPANQGLVVLEAEARYARERYQLYRARAYGRRAASPARLRELERVWKLAESRLSRARHPHDRASRGPMAVIGPAEAPWR
jgi:hypothetical protein